MKSLELENNVVIPAKAGIHSFEIPEILDSCFRRNDEGLLSPRTFLCWFNEKPARNDKLIAFFFLIFLGAISTASALPSGDLAQFEKANIAYRQGQFDEASALYQSLAEKYPEQAAFHYNLGNALHRKGEQGSVILAYERARRQAPRDEDILTNLNYARGLLEYRIEDKRLWPVRIADVFLGYFTPRELKLFALGAAFLFLVNWALMLFVKPESGWSGLRKFLLVLALLGVTLVIVKGIQENFFKEAIVTAKEAQVYYGPSVNDQAAFRLGDGLKVYVLDAREGWNRILTASGEGGWIQSDQIAEIKHETLKNITG